MKEIEGEVTGDDVRANEGRAQGAKGDLESKAQGVKDAVQGAARQIAGDARGDEGQHAEGSMQRAKGDLER